MDAVKLKKYALLFCMAALLLAGCGRTGSSAGTAGTRRLMLTQEATVRRETFRENPDFSRFLSESTRSFYLPGLSQHMIPQGISVSEETGLTYLSAYAASPLIPSVIAAVDTDTGILQAEYWLYEEGGTPFSGHVGGLAAAGDYLYLSAGKDGQYRIARLDLRTLPRQGGCPVTLDSFQKVQISPSFLNASEGFLFIGNFYHPAGKYGLPHTVSAPVETADGSQGCFILVCPLTDQGELTLEDGYPRASAVLSAPDRIQGFSCQEGSILLSQSYGRKNNSAILRYDPAHLPSGGTLSLCGQTLPLYLLDSRSLQDRLTAMPMAEGLCRGPDGSLMVLFESGAMKYSDGKDRTDALWSLRLS